MPSVFISYRREDAAAHAGRLYDRLAARHGAAQVFMDVDTLEPGQSFPEVIRARLGDAAVVLVLIGRQWLQARDARGARRLDDPADFVRLEVAAALRSAATVIPVLVGGAVMPAAAELPEELRPLALRHAVEISDTRFQHDSGVLIEAVGRVVPAPPRRRRALWAGAGVLALAGLAGAWVLHGQDGQPARYSAGPPLRAADDPAAPPRTDERGAALRWRASHLLVAVPPGADAAVWRAALERAQRLERQVRRDPGQFAALAQRDSDDSSSAARGGDLGYFVGGTMTPPFEAAVAQAHRGDIVGPVETRYGFHVILVTAVQRSTRVVMNGMEVFEDMP